MDKHQTENPAGKAIHHFKAVGLLGCVDIQPNLNPMGFFSIKSRQFGDIPNVDEAGILENESACDLPIGRNHVFG